MAQRTNEAKVRAIIDDDPDVDIAAQIDTAVALTDYVASQDTDSVLTAALLLEIETYLAAHFYEHLDPQFSEKRTGEASAVFQGRFDKGLESSKWGQTAKRLDVTGTLGALDSGMGLRSISWLGKPVSDQTLYVDRD